jgi:hypothetical protein
LTATLGIGTFAAVLRGIRPRSRLHGLTAILALAVIAVGQATPAAAAYQPVFADGGGADAAASIYCSPGLIRLGDPVIWAIPPGDAISARTHWVAWSVSIWYSTDLQTWAPSGATPYWYLGKVNDRYYSITYNAQWYSTQFQAWATQSNPYWTASLKGYYAATMQIVWYLEDGSVATLTGQPAAYTLGAGGLWSDRSPYCTMY